MSRRRAADEARPYSETCSETRTETRARDQGAEQLRADAAGLR